MRLSLIDFVLIINFIGLLANAISIFIIFGETDFFKNRHHYEKMILLIVTFLGIENTIFALYPLDSVDGISMAIIRAIISILVFLFGIMKYRQVSMLTDKNKDVTNYITLNIMSSITENKEFLNVVPFMATLSNSDGLISYYNKNFEKLVPIHLQGDSFNVKDLGTSKAATELILHSDKEVIVTNDSVYVSNIPIILSNGVGTTYEAIKFPVKLPNGENGVLSFYQDVSHRYSDRLSNSTINDILIDVEFDEGLIIIDHHKQEVHINKFWATWLGTSSSSTVVSFREWKEFFDKRDYIDFDTQMAYHSAREGVMKLEFRMHSRNSKSKWVEFRGRVIERNDNGEPIIIAGKLQDVNDEKLIELSSVLNDSIIHTGNVCFVLTDPQGTILRANKAFASLVGAKQEALIDGKIYEYHYNYAGEGFENIWYDLKINKSISFETVYRNEDYDPIPVEINATFIENSGNEYASIFITSIDERMKMLEQIQKSNEQLRLTMEGINEVMLEIDFVEKAIILNDRGYELLGISEDEVDIFTRWKEMIHPQDEFTFFNELTNEQNRCGTLTTNVRFRIYDDSWCWFEVCGKFFMPDKLGKCTKFFGIVRDINTQVELEKQLKEGMQMLQDAETIAKMGHFSYDLEKNIISRNADTLSLLNISNQEEELSYEEFIDEVHEDDRKYVDFKLRDAIWNRTHFDIVYRMNDDDNKLKFINARAKAVYDENGRPIVTMGTLIDVTDQKIREQAIYKTQHTLESIVENSPIGMLVVEVPSMNIATANERAEMMLAFDKGMKTAEKWEQLDELVIMDQHEEITTFSLWCQDFLSNEKDDELAEIRLLGENERYIEAFLDKTESTNDEVDYLLIISLNDITRVKRVSKDLIEEKERLSIAESMSRIGNWSFDGTSLRLSDGLRSMVGMEVDKILVGDEIIDVFNELVDDKYKALIQKLPTDEEPVITLRYDLKIADNLMTVEETRKVNGNRYFGVLQDVTRTDSLIRRLERSKRDMTALINSISEDVIYYDSSLNVIVSNREVGMINKEKSCVECKNNNLEQCKHCFPMKAMDEARVITKIEETKDHRFIKFTASPVYGENMDIVGVVETRLDVTNAMDRIEDVPITRQLDIQREFVSNLMKHCQSMCEQSASKDPKGEVMDHTMGRLAVFTGEAASNKSAISFKRISERIGNHLEKEHDIILDDQLEHHRIDDINIDVDIDKFRYVIKELLTNARRESDDIQVMLHNTNGYDITESLVWGNVKKIEYAGIVVTNKGNFDQGILKRAVYPFVSGYQDTEGLGLSEVLGIALSYDGFITIRSVDNLTQVGVYISLEQEMELPIDVKLQHIVNALKMHLPVKQLPEYVEVIEWLKDNIPSEILSSFVDSLNQYEYDDALKILKEIEDGEAKNLIS